MNDEQVITKFIMDNPYKIKIIRGQRGAVGWEVSVSGNDKEGVLKEVEEINQALMNKFGGN